MTPEERGAAQDQLKDVEAALLALEEASGEGREQLRGQLLRRAISLRIQLSGDGGGPAVLSRPHGSPQGP